MNGGSRCRTCYLNLRPGSLHSFFPSLTDSLVSSRREQYTNRNLSCSSPHWLRVCVHTPCSYYADRGSSHVSGVRTRECGVRGSEKVKNEEGEREGVRPSIKTKVVCNASHDADCELLLAHRGDGRGSLAQTRGQSCSTTFSLSFYPPHKSLTPVNHPAVSLASCECFALASAQESAA